MSRELAPKAGHRSDARRILEFPPSLRRGGRRGNGTQSDILPHLSAPSSLPQFSVRGGGRRPNEISLNSLVCSSWHHIISYRRPSYDELRLTLCPYGNVWRSADRR